MLTRTFYKTFDMDNLYYDAAWYYMNHLVNGNNIKGGEGMVLGIAENVLDPKTQNNTILELEKTLQPFEIARFMIASIIALVDIDKITSITVLDTIGKKYNKNDLIDSIEKSPAFNTLLNKMSKQEQGNIKIYITSISEYENYKKDFPRINLEKLRQKTITSALKKSAILSAIILPVSISLPILLREFNVVTLINELSKTAFLGNVVNALGTGLIGAAFCLSANLLRYKFFEDDGSKATLSGNTDAECKVSTLRTILNTSIVFVVNTILAGLQEIALHHIAEQYKPFVYIATGVLMAIADFCTICFAVENTNLVYRITN